jgi:hypothetical protein
MVDGTDYDFWRAQYNTPNISSGSGATAANTAGKASGGAASDLTIADSSSEMQAVTAPISSSSNYRVSSKVAVAVDDVFEKLVAGKTEHRIATLAAAVRSAAGEQYGDWASLLSYLAESKAQHDLAGFSFDASHSEQLYGQTPSEHQCSLGQDVTQTNGLRRAVHF